MFLELASMLYDSDELNLSPCLTLMTQRAIILFSNKSLGKSLARLLVGGMESMGLF